jgi:acetyl-CoA carboxylase biotin carboxyl carrier protein
MNIKEIKELLDLFTDSGIAEMEVQRGDNRLRLKRAGTMHEVAVAASGEAGQIGAPPSMSANSGDSSRMHAVEAHPSPKIPAPQPAASSSEILVKSPIVGTYYDAPSPDAAVFVKVGDSVEPGQVLCIIESMKLMNEIEAEVAGTIVNKLCENGRPVEYGEALFTVRPR